MREDDIERVLQSIGKRCFVNCYDVAKRKGENLTKEDLIKNDPDLEGTKESGLATRLSGIKRIFRANLLDKALKMAKDAKNYK